MTTKKRTQRVFNIKNYVISVLRRASYRSPIRTEVLRAARTSRNAYVCTTCKKIFPRKSIQVDHIEPVIPLTGWVSFDDYINRLFCSANGLQVLCQACHWIKSASENKTRRVNKKGKK